MHSGPRQVFVAFSVAYKPRHLSFCIGYLFAELEWLQWSNESASDGSLKQHGIVSCCFNLF